MKENQYFKNLINRVCFSLDVVISVFNISLFLLLLNLLSLNLGMLKPSFILVLATYLLVGIVLFNLPFRSIYLAIVKKTLKYFDKIFVGIILILFSFILLLFIKIQMFWIAIIPMFISGLDMVLQGFGIERKELYFLSVASFIYALFFIILQIKSLFLKYHQKIER